MMRHKTKLKKRYRVPSEIGLLVAVTAAIFFIFWCICFIWISFSSKEFSFVDRVLFFPRYCLELSNVEETGFLSWWLRLFRVFFFAAMVTLFYEIYKYLIERYRICKVENAIYNFFLWTSNKDSGRKYRYVPYYKTFVTLRARFGYSEEDIFKACTSSPRLRVINLATTRARESYPHDRLAVECYYRNTEYGCKINRNSQVTIVVPSTHFGLSKFGFYLSYYGGFNFISKENPDHDSSEGYYSISNEDLSRDNNALDFVSDAKDMVSDQSSWVIVLSFLPFRDGNKISIHHQKGASGRYMDFCGKLPDAISNVIVEKKETKINQDNILERIIADKTPDGFIMKISDETLVWNLSRVKIAREVAKALCEAFGIEFSEGTGKYERKEKWMVGFPEGYFESKEENISEKGGDSK